MKAKTLAGIGILLTVITLGYASAEKTADRPPGIGADQWYPISDRLGLVVSDYQPGLDPLVDNDHVKPVPAPSGATLPPRPACGAPSCGAMPPASVVPGLS